MQYKVQLVDDGIIHNHLTALYDTLLEQNLVREGSVWWGACLHLTLQEQHTSNLHLWSNNCHNGGLSAAQHMEGCWVAKKCDWVA